MPSQFGKCFLADLFPFAISLVQPNLPLAGLMTKYDMTPGVVRIALKSSFSMGNLLGVNRRISPSSLSSVLKQIAKPGKCEKNVRDKMVPTRDFAAASLSNCGHEITYRW